jgi:hypothetical protein
VSSETDHPLMPVVKAWQEKIRQAAELKSKRFGKDAEEGMLFLAGPYDWLYDGKKGARHFFPPDGADLPTPTFKMTLNKAAELVQLFGPSSTTATRSGRSTRGSSCRCRPTPSPRWRAATRWPRRPSSGRRRWRPRPGVPWTRPAPRSSRRT